MERSVILSLGPTLRAPLAELQADGVQTARGTLAEMEREYIFCVLQRTGGVISAAATRLGVRVLCAVVDYDPKASMVVVEPEFDTWWT